MGFIVDASVALKWVIDEDRSDAARRLLETETLAAPEFMWLESANAVWKRVRRKLISEETGRLALAAINAAPVEAIPLGGRTEAAYAVAAELDQTVYDCLYLATAIARHAKLVTADSAFVRAASGHAVYRDSVLML